MILETQFIMFDSSKYVLCILYPAHSPPWCIPDQKYPRHCRQLRLAPYFEHFRRSNAHSTYIPSWLEYTSHFRTSNPLLSKSFLARLLTFLNRPRYDHALYPRISSHALSFRGGFSFYHQLICAIDGSIDITDICILVPSPTFLSAIESFRNELNYCTCKCSVLY